MCSGSNYPHNKMYVCGHKSELPPIVGQPRITVGFNNLLLTGVSA